MIKDRRLLLSTAPTIQGSGGTPSVAWINIKSDILLDTSVIGWVKDDAPNRRRLIRRVNQLTEVAGSCWIAVDTLNELVRTPPDGRLQAVVSALLHIDAEVRGRLRVLDLVTTAHRRELVERRTGIDTWPLASLSSELANVARTGSLDGAPTLQRGLEQTERFLQRHRAAMKEVSDAWKKKRAENPSLVEEVRVLLGSFRAPQALLAPRALLELVCRDYGWKPERVKIELDRAHEQPEKYWSCWTWGLLISLLDLLETVPARERMELDPQIGALRTDRNDWMDANIVGAGARCGTLITADRDLHLRCALLYDRDLIGICSELFSAPGR